MTHDRERRHSHEQTGVARKAVRDVMIILGPPGPDEEKRRLEQWATNSGKPQDQIWVEFVHDVLGEFTQRDSPDSPNELDKLLSSLVGTSVRVSDPFLTYMFLGGIMCPGIILYPTRITSEAGEPLSIDFSNPELRNALGAVFGYILKTEWVRTFVTCDS